MLKVRVRDTRLFLEDPVLHVDDDQRRPPRPRSADCARRPHSYPACHRCTAPGFSNARQRYAIITGKLSGSRLSDLQPFWQRARARARAQGCPHPRSATHVCLGRRRRRPGPADDRQAARAYAGGDDRPLRSSRGGSGRAGVVGNRFGTGITALARTSRTRVRIPFPPPVAPPGTFSSTATSARKARYFKGTYRMG